MPWLRYFWAHRGFANIWTVNSHLKGLSFTALDIKYHKTRAFCKQALECLQCFGFHTGVLSEEPQVKTITNYQHDPLMFHNHRTSQTKCSVVCII